MSLFDAAWAIYGKPKSKRSFLQRWLFDLINPPDSRLTVFACHDCQMPLDANFQKSNVRTETVDEELCYILSCPWCYRVMNIGAVAEIDKTFLIARKEPPDGTH